MNFKSEELLIVLIARMLKSCRHVAVGASSPIPASAAILAKEIWPCEKYISILGSSKYNLFTNGGVELFDCAAQGRIDAFFLGGGQIDGQANVNLVGIGAPPIFSPKFSGSYGSTYLYFLIPKVILFRDEHTKRVMVPKVDFISAPGSTSENVFRPGGPYALVTSKCVFLFNAERKKFRLSTLHPGETLVSVRENTGFEYDQPKQISMTEIPDRHTLHVLRTKVADNVAEIYPLFCNRVFGNKTV